MIRYSPPLTTATPSRSRFRRSKTRGVHSGGYSLCIKPEALSPFGELVPIYRDGSGRKFCGKGLLVLAGMILTLMTMTAQTLSKNDPLKFDADYYLMEKEFTKALNTYKNILRSEPDNADIKYKIGICYLNSENEKDLAIKYLDEASQKVSEKHKSSSFDETNAPIDAFFLLGSAYRVNNQIDKAIEAYKKYRDLLDPKDEYNFNAVNQYIRSCEMAATMLQNPVPVKKYNLGSPLNNESPNFNAVVSGDGKTMFFTSPAKEGYIILKSLFNDTAWSTPVNVTSALGTGKYMKTSDLSYDGKILLLTLDDALNSDIYICRFNKGKWSKAEPLGKEINSKFNETHASLSTDGRVLYFTSDRKGGEGDLDIYKSVPDDNGNWGKPVNLGPIINTPLNEETPFVTEIGDKLYFSSEGHQGIGGYDIYCYDFSNPSAGVVNLGYPVNSTDNDLFFVPSGDGHSAYFALNGEDSRGGRDIYRITFPESLPQSSEAITVSGQSADTLSNMTAITASGAQTAEEYSIIEQIENNVTQLNETISEPSGDEHVNEVVSETIKAILSESAGDEPDTEVLSDVLPVIKEQAEVSGSFYKIQIMALLKQVDLKRFSGVKGVTVARKADRWYRYTLGNTTDKQEAETLLTELKSKGYRDAFIRSEPIAPQFTIQVMAVPGPVVNLEKFSDLPSIAVTRGPDSFCRYTTGEFPTKEEAVGQLNQVKNLGYETAFVTRMK